MELQGLHHITMITGDAQKNIDFYADTLGLRLVKKTVNFDAPDAYHQPIVCMQCENAPCETVCPVAATLHGAEAHNDMFYNRLGGTPTGANKCPNKVGK